MDTKCIIIHHGGEWKNIPPLTYVSRRTSIVDNLPDDITPAYFRNIINELGYSNIIKLHYVDPTKDYECGIRFLGYDNLTFSMFISLFNSFGMMHVYCEHESVDGHESHNFLPNNLDGLCNDDNISFEDSIDLNLHSNSIDGVGLRNDNIFNDNDGVNIPTCDLAIDINNVDYDDEGSDEDDDEIIDARVKVHEDKRKQKEFDGENEKLNRLAARKGMEFVDSDYEGSSDFVSPSEDSDEDDCGYLLAPPCERREKKVRQFNEGTTSIDNDFFVGQEFENANEFRKAITDYCVRHGKDTKSTKSNKKRVGARCKIEGCPWYIWASLKKNKNTFQVKTYIHEHTCGRSHKVKKLTAKWIAVNYQKKFKVNPYMKLQEIIDTVWSEWGIKITMWKACIARKKAQGTILSEYREQYGLLHRYAAEIKRANKENTVIFKLEQGVFSRMYICFAALRKGFLAGCRPFISIDGCFLKGSFGGQLLVAVGRDGNNQMFPICWALVEVESTKTWSWFLELLANELNTIDGHGYTIMSDQQKVLLNAVAEIWPKADTRCCARHVYCNFRAIFGGGQEYKKQFWKIAKSTTENDFKANIEVFSSISKSGAADLMKRNYKKWVRAFFTYTPSCDSVDNNMSEVFNAYILKSRHKPLITMLEDTRENLMERLHKKRDFIKNKDIIVCPMIQRRLEQSKFYARGWSAYWDGNFSYGVREGATQIRYVVKLLDRTCTCNSWQLSGIPCNHAVAAIWSNKERPEHYVSEHFTKQYYLKAYDFVMEPLNGPQE